ncbi:FHA domain-containing protein [Crateriforma conspicua]|uniref:FHA domain protein n=1 Tax=Crateriforma conspicua TaxID=2527996 RepID=A0A5C5Y7P7_9PLAN|nr:FHA domain-containing protein [Crateriforma conspicua]QDV65804.1 FHA domain protein [Crateriforma conspicua]TWT71204.1 FHA domain protein [Crateriforma conspicua]
MLVKLKVCTGSHEGKEIAVASEKFLVGRSESCQLRPKSESVSRKHCILVLRNGRVLLQDLKSRNGTFVNDKRLPPDKAKVLKPGDRLRIGKLEFEILIEHGLNAAKKPEVKNVGDAAERVVQSGAEESRFEDIDVSSWLDEADQIDRVRQLADPETRQFHIDASESVDAEHGTNSDSDSGELSVEESDKPKRPSKQKPGKLPDNVRRNLTENSRDAADDALKRFFTGR